MANVYTSRLYAATGLGIGSFTSAVVPAGFEWVIVDICAYNGLFGTTSSHQACVGLRVGLLGGQAVIMDTGFSRSVSGQVYRWKGRQVVLAGEAISGYARDTSWNITITGFVLSLP